jgi:hypothetical protein
VRVGARQALAQREPADAGVGGEPLAVDLDALEGELERRELAPAAGQEREPAGARDRPGRGSREQAERPRR